MVKHKESRDSQHSIILVYVIINGPQKNVLSSPKEQSLIRPTSKNLQLTVSILIIIPIALAYGLYPQKILPLLFDFKADATNLANIFRAMMGLYLGMSVIWIMGIIKPGLWVTATITNIIFMGGLALGRLVSLALDGVPGIYLLIGFVLESALAIWGLKNLKKYGTGSRL